MKESNIELIFPIPVMFNELNRKFTKEELSFVNKHSKKINKNIGNVTSINNYILNEPEFFDLKNIITEHLNKYVETIIKPLHEVEIYITQSWLNYTNKNEFHHKHEHQNSYLSGCLYIQADETKDKITFHKSGYQQIKLPTENYTIMNSDSWWFNVKSEGIVIFPSSLTHNVENVISNETRISIAFNSFVKGIFGDNKSLTELINK